MSIRIGLYDFFSYTIPGLLYLAVAAFALDSFGFVNFDLSSLQQLSLVSVAGLMILSYIVGLVLDSVSIKWQKSLRRKNRGTKEMAYESFKVYHPWLRPNFQATDYGILLQLLKVRSSQAAIDIEILNASSIMLRNISLATASFSILSLLVFIVFRTNLWLIAITISCILFSYLSIRRSAVHREWFYSHIFQAAASLSISPETLFMNELSPALAESQPRTIASERIDILVHPKEASDKSG